jgi:hypothetical protein
MRFRLDRAHAGLVLALTALGCFGPSGPSRFTSESLATESPRAVSAVKLATVLPPEHESRLAAYGGREVFESRLVEDLTAAGFLSPEADLELQVDIVGFRFRTGATSIWVGSMAGADSITVKANVRDGDASLGSFTSSASSIKGGLLMPSSNARMRNLAYALSERVVRQFAKMPLSKRERSRGVEHSSDSESDGIEYRLRRLQALYEDELIGEADYEAKRREILGDL